MPGRTDLVTPAHPCPEALFALVESFSMNLKSWFCSSYQYHGQHTRGLLLPFQAMAWPSHLNGESRLHTLSRTSSGWTSTGEPVAGWTNSACDIASSARMHPFSCLHPMPYCHKPQSVPWPSVRCHALSAIPFDSLPSAATPACTPFTL